MRSFVSDCTTKPAVFQAVRRSRRVQLWNRQASIIKFQRDRKKSRKRFEALRSCDRFSLYDDVGARTGLKFRASPERRPVPLIIPSHCALEYQLQVLLKSYCESTVTQACKSTG
jgi:hypothetical protein